MTTDSVFGRALVGFVVPMMAIVLVQGCALLSPDLAGPPTTAGLPSPAFTATPVRGAGPTPSTPAPSLEEEARDAIRRGVGILSKISPTWYLRARAPGEDREEWRRYEEGWDLIEQGIRHLAVILGDSLTSDELIHRLGETGLVDYRFAFSKPSMPSVRSFEVRNTDDLVGLTISPHRLPGSAPGPGGDNLILRRGEPPVLFSWFRQPGFWITDLKAQAWHHEAEERVVLAAGLSSSGRGEAHSTNLLVVSFVENRARVLWHGTAGGSQAQATFTGAPGVAPGIVVTYTRWAQTPFLEANAGPHVRNTQTWEYNGVEYEKMEEKMVDSPYTGLWFFVYYMRAGDLEAAKGYRQSESAIAEAMALGLDQPRTLITNVTDQISPLKKATAATGWIALASDPRLTPIAFVDMLKVGDKWLVGGFRAKED